jgi:dienelactone hydrolase
MKHSKTLMILTVVTLLLAASDAHAQVLPPIGKPKPRAQAADVAESNERSAGREDREAAGKEGDADVEKRPVRPVDYGKWESLGWSNALSPDGRWLAYQISRVNDENELRLRMLATDATETFPYGSRPAFSADNNWLAFSIGVSEDEREKLQKAGKPARNKLGLHDLTNGETEEIENVASFSFSDDGAYLVMRRYPGDRSEHAGVDIVLRNLATGIDTNFGNVSQYAFNDDGTMLAMIIDAVDRAGNGVQIYDAATGMLRTLESADAKYGSMTWREDAADLAVMREMEHEDDEDVSHVVVTWRGLDGDSPRKKAFDHLECESFPEDMRVVDYAGLRWSEDGRTVFFGIKAWEKKPKALEKSATEGGDEESKDESDSESGAEGPAKPRAGEKRDSGKEEGGASLRETLDDPPGVDVWHASDVDIIPRQKRIANREKRENYLAAWWIESDAFVQLGDELVEDVSLQEKHKHAIGTDQTPYEKERMFGPRLVDVYLIDVETGERERILESLKYGLGSSPCGRYYLYLSEDAIHAYDIERDEHINLTGGIESSFVNLEDDTLTEEKRPYGVCGWVEDESAVFLYDRFDIWMIPMNSGDPVRVTNGAPDQIRHRRVVLDREEDEFIEPDEPMYVSLYGETTKRSGYGRMFIGEAVEKLVYEDRSIGRLMRAEDADVFCYTAQTYDDSPDLFIAGADLDDARQVTETNPFQDEYLWGRAELIDYENVQGEPLQAALIYPADYEEGREYPMIVYIYEKLSRMVHRYWAPSERSAYNAAVFSAEDYFVLMPDIVYRPQNPGLSSVECVTPAVEKAIDTGMIDRDAIGLVGHSWGAYQTAFIVTQTDLFAAGIAGAPLTDMMSMSMGVYWNSGGTNARIFFESQGRMDHPFWRDVRTYIANSPIFSVDELNTPLLIAFGDEDGAVDWNQGVEMYNAARLAGKQLVMLVYAGENHGLRQKPNQVDYHYRIIEWFGHYLKGEEAPKWITEGVSYLEAQKEREEQSGGGGRGRGPRRSR